ncbi:palmitoyltransferase [Perkinsus olseni]|uniref:Palmitoyltransferase n=1 Tax=Perkinsus olseni TaxID=32597 RepID=A0A7J6NKY8_PEROL|nr:palmitoyltransferase [Perkinsus olseni]KAF4683761.1 palmitoyltransferase [Perkinsus olseni]KAF4692907.1 palmitoyltransferase [Perkinsus olseni]KAF4751126.1 palmitoyltransferase [Perkinsus olseni]KAF4759428.1 palmitoyltransferase [Perkinsus olseni]
MQILACILYKYEPEKATEVATFYDLHKISYFQRKTVKEFIKFHARAIVSRTAKGQRQSVQFEQNIGKCHVYVAPDGLGAACLTDGEYPMRVAFAFISELMRGFETKHPVSEWTNVRKDTNIDYPEGDELMEKFQDPSQADKIAQIQKELDDVKGVVIKSMDDILRRGETLDSLMQKSNDLSNTSYQFYRTAKKNNQCCKYY